MPVGPLAAVGTTYSVKAPEVVILVNLLPKCSVVQRFPSGPTVMELPASGTLYSVKTPAVVTLATLPALTSENQRFPSGPCTIANGELLAVGTMYSVMSPIAARALPLPSMISPAAANPPTATRTRGGEGNDSDGTPLSRREAFDTCPSPLPES